MKVLVIAALLALLLLLIYSRLYPYLQVAKKILSAALKVTSPRGEANSSSINVDRKLVRCVSCGTWIPAERAIGKAAGQSVYCSRECIEKSAAPDKRKAAS